MRLVAVSRILNEADIIEAFVRHTAHFVDHHIIVDNGSIDGTLAILEKLKQEGLRLSVFQTGARSFLQTQVNTFLYRVAVSRAQANWVVYLDADEFIDVAQLRQPLRDTLVAFTARYGAATCVSVPLRDYCQAPDDPADAAVPLRLRYCGALTDNTKVIVPAGLLARNAIVLPGNHSVQIDHGAACPMQREPTLSYAHYPQRSVWQWMSKTVIGWSKVLAAGPELANSRHSVHYKGAFEHLRNNPAPIFANPAVMQVQPPGSELLLNPLDYYGGPLKYTGQVDYAMRAVQVMLQYLHELAGQHGEMLELIHKLNGAVSRNEDITPLF